MGTCFHFVESTTILCRVPDLFRFEFEDLPDGRLRRLLMQLVLRMFYATEFNIVLSLFLSFVATTIIEVEAAK